MINRLPFIRLQHGIIPASYSDSLSYLEQVLRLTKKLNEAIERLNYIDNYISTIDINFDEIKEDILQIKNQLANLSQTILLQVDAKLFDQQQQVISLLNNYQAVTTQNIQILRDDLENQIEQIQLGNVVAYNPTNGQIENLNVVLQDIFDVNRRDAITATEFDELELTATEFANKNITAFDFDVNGKALLTA